MADRSIHNLDTDVCAWFDASAVTYWQSCGEMALRESRSRETTSCRRRSWSHCLTLQRLTEMDGGYALERAFKWLNDLVRSPETWNYFLPQKINCTSLILPLFLSLSGAASSPALSKASLSPQPPSEPLNASVTPFGGNLVIWLLFLRRWLLSWGSCE